MDRKVVAMSEFKLPEHDFALDQGETKCYYDHTLKQALRDVLEQAAQLIEQQDTQQPKHNAKAVRKLKESIK